MSTILKYWEILKLVFKYFRFKIRQNRLKTDEKAIVETTYGPIQGVKRISIWNVPFFSFEKIPFAKPPIGELRFKAPVPPDPWEEVKDCTEEGPMPLQLSLVTKNIEGSEDCLYLNVYTKNLKPETLMPVMIWIYGGGFENGGATKNLYSPDYFMEKDVVLITIAYRVGPFGFLSFDDSNLNVPGNAGLKDQILALKWIKANCMNFGGNPDNITLFGESAGAASTHYMMLTDQTRGLFHKAILMSGSVLCPWAKSVPKNWGYRLARILGYGGPNDDKEVFQFLCSNDGKHIIKVIRSVITEEERKNRISFAFGPVIEPYITEDCVVPFDPRRMMHACWGNQIPIMIGGTSFEGLFCYYEIKKNKNVLEDINDCEYLVPAELNLDRCSPRCRELGLKLKTLHFGDKIPGKSTVLEYLDLLSYKYILHGLHRTIQSRLKFSTNDTYLYRFDFDSPFFNYVRNIYCGNEIRSGVSHADDLSYIFLNAMSDNLDKSSFEYKTIQYMIGILTEFALKSNPNYDALQSVDWKPLQKNVIPYKCLNISREIEIIDLPEMDKLLGWDDLYDNIGLI